MERSVSGGEFKAKEHRYGFAEFQSLVKEIEAAAEKFVAAIGATPEEIIEFVKAALSLNHKST
jgi:hypothetical protein